MSLPYSAESPNVKAVSQYFRKGVTSDGVWIQRISLGCEILPAPQTASSMSRLIFVPLHATIGRKNTTTGRLLERADL